MEEREDYKLLNRLLLIAYTLVILYFLFIGFGRVEKSHIRETYRYSLEIYRIPLWFPKSLSIRWIFSLGNLLAFVPYGILIPKNFNCKFIKTILIFLVFIFTMEVLQMVTYLGSFDLEDILINTIGVITGYISYRLALKKDSLCGKLAFFIMYVMVFTFLLIGFAEYYNATRF